MSRRDEIISNLPQLSLTFREACGDECRNIAGRAFDAAIEEVRKIIADISYPARTHLAQYLSDEVIDTFQIQESLDELQGGKDGKE